MLNITNGILVKESGILDRLTQGAATLGGKVQRGAQTAAQFAQKVIADPNYAHLAKTPAVQSAVTAHAPQIQSAIKSVTGPAGKATTAATDWIPPVLQRRMGMGGEKNTAISTARDIGLKAVAPFRKAYRAGLKA
jgi:hypothetical protein